MTFDLMMSVLKEDSINVNVRGVGGEGVWLSPQSRNRMLQSLLMHHFSLLKMLARNIIENKSLVIMPFCNLSF